MGHLNQIGVRWNFKFCAAVAFNPNAGTKTTGSEDVMNWAS